MLWALTDHLLDLAMNTEVRLFCRVSFVLIHLSVKTIFGSLTSTDQIERRAVGSEGFPHQLDRPVD